MPAKAGIQVFKSFLSEKVNVATIKEIRVPDIGGATNVNVIEVLVAPGAHVKKEESLITLEGDKATMEIPSPYDGVVEQLKIKVGDKVAEGTLILTLRMNEETMPMETVAPPPSSTKPQTAKPAATAEQTEKEVHIPDIGSTGKVSVIEVSVKPGDEIKVEDPLITLEGDKATMEIPAPYAGKVTQVKLKVGDKVATGDVVLIMQTRDLQQPAAQMPAAKTEPAPAAASSISSVAPQPPAAHPPAATSEVHAGPGVRRLAREFGIDLNLLAGSGEKGRIVKEDVQTFVKTELQKAKTAGGLAMPTAPVVDFSKFGAIETKPLNKIKRLTGVNVHRSWITVPHVTQFDEADITELEAFRQGQKAAAEAQGVKLTPLVFIMKAVAAALKAFPIFNASLDPTGENLILKKYFHLGIAVDTPNGLVVPVIRDVDQKGMLEIAKELAVISKKAREKGLTPLEMAGSCFTISSLGGIGGTAFTPIVNTPDVAILGISRAAMKPIYQNGQFVPRLMLPLSLSYDHRVVDGADGARFITYVANALADIRTLLL
jgi:pyruvate dehydrogenase E2 component (dihydrolipoamide acetyltransferase)